MKAERIDSLKPLLAKMAPSSQRRLREDVLDFLREAITRGYLDAGEHLAEPSLAELLDVSRGPVREALVELEREGLVRLQRRKGATVIRLTENDIEEIYSLRGTLERLAVERAIRFATDEDFADMDAIVDQIEEAARRNDVQHAVDLDVEFHDSLYLAAHHTRLYGSWVNIRSQVRAFLISSVTTESGYLHTLVPEHSSILHSLRARKEHRAVELSQTHLHHAYMRLTGQYQQHSAQDKD